MTAVAMVGLGVMGSAMANVLAGADGIELAVFDVRGDVTVPPGATRSASAADAAAGRDVVVVSVPGPPEVLTAMLAAGDGVLAGLATGAAGASGAPVPAAARPVVVDTTTSSLEVCRTVAAACAAAGAGYLDAPVTGRPPAMTMLVGGDTADLDGARPVLDLIAAQVCHLGGTGAGCVAKLVNQLLIYGNFLTMCEGFALAAKAGVGIDLHAAVAAWRTGAADSASLARLSGPVLRGQFADARGAPLDLVAKDMGLLADLAADLEVPSAVAARLDSVFARGQREGFGAEFFAAVAKVIELEATTRLGDGDRRQTGPEGGRPA